MSTNGFGMTSRYATITVVKLELPDGTEVAYLRRRFVPSPNQFVTLHEHIVTAGERPDTVAAQYLSDPEQFWQLCDANNVLQPEELTAEPGRRLRITLPAGIPGSPYA